MLTDEQIKALEGRPLTADEGAALIADTRWVIQHTRDDRAALMAAMKRMQERSAVLGEKHKAVLAELREQIKLLETENAALKAGWKV